MVEVKIYLWSGVIKAYEVKDEDAGREYADRICRDGYRSFNKETGEMVIYPPHQIYKIKLTPFKGGHYADKSA